MFFIHYEIIMILVTICHCRVITELLTIVLMLYTISMWGIYNWKFVPLHLLQLFSFCLFFQHPPLWQSPELFSESLILVFFFFLDHRNKWNHTVFVFLWLISCSIILSGSSQVVTDGKISFLYIWVIFHCV